MKTLSGIALLVVFMIFSNKISKRALVPAVCFISVTASGYDNLPPVTSAETIAPHIAASSDASAMMSTHISVAAKSVAALEQSLIGAPLPNPDYKIGMVVDLNALSEFSVA